MAFILNEYEIENAQLLAREERNRPRLQAAVLTLARLVEWTNNNSDGWAYWRKPVNASTKLQELVRARYARFNREDTPDITLTELKAAETPIKAFLTRQGVDHSLVFPNGYAS
jgi:hypothetical protein